MKTNKQNQKPNTKKKKKKPKINQIYRGKTSKKPKNQIERKLSQQKSLTNTITMCKTLDKSNDKMK